MNIQSQKSDSRSTLYYFPSFSFEGRHQSLIMAVLQNREILFTNFKGIFACLIKPSYYLVISLHLISIPYDFCLNTGVIWCLALDFHVIFFRIVARFLSISIWHSHANGTQAYEKEWLCFILYVEISFRISDQRKRSKTRSINSIPKTTRNVFFVHILFQRRNQDGKFSATIVFFFKSSQEI